MDLTAMPPLEERTMSAVFERRLAEAPDTLALTGPDGRATAAEAHDRGLTLAGGLAELGVGDGGFALLMLDNSLDFAQLILGLALSGRVEVPVNTAYKGRILAHVVNDSTATVMVAEDRYCTRIADVAAELEHLRTVVVRGGDGAALAGTGLRVVPWAQLEAATPAARAATAPWDPMGVMYTSGTTGPSKGVLVCHAHAYGYSTPWAFGEGGPDDIGMVSLPLFHIGGQWACLYKALIGGGGAAVVPGFSASTYWDDVRRYGATETLMLGAVANFLWRQPPREDDHTVPMRRAIMVPVIPEVEEFARRFDLRAGSAYGLTEGSSPVIAPYGTARPQKAGRPRPDFDVRIVDEHDREVAPGEAGEVLLRPHDPWSVMLGYFNRPEATTRAWRNLWLHTGDAMRRDADGDLVFVDRADDAIRRRGENVSSFEVEAVVNEHPAVLESAAVAVASEHTEHEIKVVVVLREGETVAPEALLRFCADRMAYFMVPRYLEFADALPKTPTEKVRKAALREAGVTGATWDREAAGVTIRRDG